MSVKKIIKINSKSEKGFEEALRGGLERTSKTVQNICCAHVDRQYVTFEDGKIKEYYVNMEVTFDVKD